MKIAGEKVEFRFGNMDILFTANELEIEVELRDYSQGRQHSCAFPIHELEARLEVSVSLVSLIKKLRAAQGEASEAVDYVFGTAVATSFVVSSGLVVLLPIEVINLSNGQKKNFDVQLSLKNSTKISPTEIRLKRQQKNIAALQQSMAKLQDQVNRIGRGPVVIEAPSSAVQNEKAREKWIKDAQVQLSQNLNEKIEITKNQVINLRAQILSRTQGQSPIDRQIQKLKEENNKYLRKLKEENQKLSQTLKEQCLKSVQKLRQENDKMHKQDNEQLNNLLKKINLKIQNLQTQIQDLTRKNPRKVDSDKSLVGLIDLSTPFAQCFSLKDNLITMIDSPDNSGAQLLFSEKIPERSLFKFSLRITNTKESNIMIGVVSTSQAQQRSSYYSSEAICFSGYGNGYIWPTGTPIGKGLKAPDLVEVSVDRNTGNVVWSVEGKFRASGRLNMLTQAGQFVPYLEMWEVGDTIEWRGSSIKHILP